MIRKAPKEFLAALAVAAGLVAWKSRTGATTYVVSDFLFIAGIALLLMGAAGAVQRSGFFGSTRYGFQLFIDLLLGRPRRPDTRGGAEHVQQQHRQGKDIRYPVAGGVICLLAAVAAAAASV